MGRMVWLDNTTAATTSSINDGGVVSTAINDAAVDNDDVDVAVMEDAIVEDDTMDDAPVAEDVIDKELLDDAAMDAEFAETPRDCCLLFEDAGPHAKWTRLRLAMVAVRVNLMITATIQQYCLGWSWMWLDGVGLIWRRGMKGYSTDSYVERYLQSLLTMA